MRVIEKTKQEIEVRLEGMGDYLRMNYLSSCLKNHLDFETRKFVLVRLSGIYEVRRMYLDSGKMMLAAADINTTFQTKIIDFIKTAELFIRGDYFELAETSMKKAIAIANENQKKEIRNSVKEFYKTHAKLCLAKDKRKKAMDAYEKILTLDLDSEERADAEKNLLMLYDKLGKIREYYNLKKNN